MTPTPLSPHEMNVLRLLLVGMNQAEIDRECGTRSTRIHVARIKAKYNLGHLDTESLVGRLRCNIEGLHYVGAAPIVLVSGTDG